MKQLEEAPAPTQAPRARTVDETYRPPYLAAAIAGLAVWALYALTLAPTTAFWDTSEYIATAHILGIPHPPGNPLFVVLARAWDILMTPLGLPVAVRINLFSATMGALAHACWFLLADRILAFYSMNRRFRLVGAAAAVLISATAFTVWNQSNVNEKVYTVSLFTIALLSWLVFRWRDRLGEGKDDNLLLLILFVLALSVGNHLMAFLAAPALIAFVLFVHPSTLWNWRLYPAALVAGVIGLSIHLFLPIRAELAPVINEADPTCPSVGSALASVLTMGRAGCPDLSASLARQQYDKPSVTLNPVDPSVPRDAKLFVAQIGNYAEYFDWQWARSIAGNQSWFGGLRPIVTLLFFTLGLFGAWTHYQRDRVSWTYMALLFATLSLGLVFYLNFKYGYTFPLGGQYGDVREVRERDYFFIVSFSLWGLWSGIGLAAAWLELTERMRDAGRKAADLIAAPVLVLAFIPLLANWSWASRAGDYSARDWAYNLLMSVEPYGVLFTNGDNDTFPLWYLQEVEGIRQDVTVMVMSYLNTPWYVRQIKNLTTPCEAGQDPSSDPTRIICQRPYDAENGPDIYRQGWIGTGAQAQAPPSGVASPDELGTATPTMPPPGQRPPTRGIINLTDAQIRQVANTPPYLLPQAQQFAAGNLAVTLPANDLVIPADAFMASIIRSAMGDRPVYFAMTTQAFEELHLRPYLIRQGVAFKLHDGPVQADTSSGIIAVPNSELSGLIGPYVDLKRSEALLSDVFVHRNGFPEEWGHWVDSATEGIPFYYGYSHYGLALVYEALGNREAAERHIRRGEAFLRLGQVRRQTD